ncbi:hypothetical protein C3B55_00188 [Candidatus Pseudomonas adelgestsugas]|uniref:Uncharacterized protein n=1 Tax=Candidatus Pseudomonas adelgestsugas TaxID=1302376 RepID=A0ABX5R7C7_9PSED|nr:hypothetical protein C3B55_00188 [Candidatus Pseudomonas adelgestsugas]
MALKVSVICAYYSGIASMLRPHKELSGAKEASIQPLTNLHT